MRGEICVGAASILSYVFFLTPSEFTNSTSTRLAATLLMIFVHVSTVILCLLFNLIQFFI